MKKLILKETRKGDFLLVNRYDYPLKKNDFTYFVKKGLLIYEEPLDPEDEYYDEPWLLYGIDGAERLDNYFFKNEALKELRERGYQLEIDTLEDQKKRERERKIKRKIKDIKKLIFTNIHGYIQSNGIYPDKVEEIDGQLFESPKNKDTTFEWKEWVINDKNNRLWALYRTGGWTNENVRTRDLFVTGKYIKTDKRFVEALEKIQEKLGEEVFDIYKNIKDYIEEKKKKQKVEEMRKKLKKMKKAHLLEEYPGLRKSWTKEKMIEYIINTNFSN